MSEIRVRFKGSVELSGAVSVNEIRSRVAAFRSLTGEEPRVMVRGSWEGGAIHFDTGGAPRPAKVEFPEPVPVLSMGRAFVQIGQFAPVSVVPERGSNVEVILTCDNVGDDGDRCESCSEPVRDDATFDPEESVYFCSPCARSMVDGAEAT